MPRARKQAVVGPTIALLDGDLIAYRIAAALEHTIDWGDDVWTLHSDLSEAKRVLDNQIATFIETLGVTKVRCAVSGKGNFRKILSPDYKANRKDKRLPIVFKPLLDYMVETYDGFRKDGIEADDVLGIWQTKAKPGETVIVSGDKDMATIPGCHYNWLKDEGIRRVTEAEATRFHMLQTLMGDTADNVPGCPGCGPVKADKILGPETCPVMMWEAVCDAFIKAGQTPADALLNARLVRILQKDDYNFSTGEVIYWNPPQ